MKRILIVIVFSVLTLTIQAVEFSGEISVERESDNISETEYISEAKLGLQYEEDNMFSEITISADSSDEEQEVEIYRAYTELYNDRLSLSLGRQKIVWGSAFLFNMSDVMSTPDPSDPSADKAGTDSIKLKYSTEDMARLELLAFSNDVEGDNLALRYTFLINNFELMFNYFDYKTEILSQTKEIKRGVIEFKGDILLGLWSQFVFQEMDSENYEYLVLGSDYSFEINERTFYILAEGLYNNNSENALIYLNYNYTFSEDISFGQSYVGAFENNAGILYNSLEYLFNDYVTIELGINFYNNIEEFSGLSEVSFDDDLENEFSFKVSSYF